MSTKEYHPDLSEYLSKEALNLTPELESEWKGIQYIGRKLNSSGQKIITKLEELKLAEYYKELNGYYPTTVAEELGYGQVCESTNESNSDKFGTTDVVLWNVEKVSSIIEFLTNKYNLHQTLKTKSIYVNGRFGAEAMLTGAMKTISRTANKAIVKLNDEDSEEYDDEENYAYHIPSLVFTISCRTKSDAVPFMVNVINDAILLFKNLKPADQYKLVKHLDSLELILRWAKRLPIDNPFDKLSKKDLANSKFSLKRLRGIISTIKQGGSIKYM